MTKTSRKGMGASMPLAISVSQLAHSLVVFAHSKVAQQKGLCFVHRGDLLFRHAQLEEV